MAGMTFSHSRKAVSPWQKLDTASQVKALGKAIATLKMGNRFTTATSLNCGTYDLDHTKEWATGNTTNDITNGQRTTVGEEWQ